MQEQEQQLSWHSRGLLLGCKGDELWVAEAGCSPVDGVHFQLTDCLIHLTSSVPYAVISTCLKRGYKALGLLWAPLVLQ